MVGATGYRVGHRHDRRCRAGLGHTLLGVAFARREGSEALMDTNTGFGWSFYGFFVVAAVWMVLYFAGAWRAAARDRDSRNR